MIPTAALFPGQGSQSVGMGRDLAEASTSVRAIYERAGELLGYDLASLCFSGPAEQLERTCVQQPAIFVTSVAIWQLMAERGLNLDSFFALAGLSLGEYTALHLAGAMGFEDALRLVDRRGRLMQEAAERTSSGMVALTRVDEETARQLCQRAQGDDILVLANLNAPGQIVVSGTRPACNRLLAVAGAQGVTASTLRVAGAFHSPVMTPAADGLWSELTTTTLSRPVRPVIANVDAEYHGNEQEIRDSLRRQLTYPVLWQRCVERLCRDGVKRFVEMGPGRTLTGLLRRIDRSVEAINISTWSDVERWSADGLNG